MQTSINPLGQPAGFAGLVADNGQVDAVSGFSEEVSASIPFGVAVAQGTAPQGALLPASSGAAIKGVSGHLFEHAPGSFGDLDAVGVTANGGRLRMIRKGRVWVVIDQSISSISPFVDRAFVRYSANGGNTQLGAFSNVTDVGHNIDLTKVAQFVSGVVTAADGTKIAQLEVDFTNKP